MTVMHTLARATAMLAGALLGLGVMFWVAANWHTWGHLGRFALLDVVIVVAGAGAMLQARWRAPLALLLFLTTGGLLASMGQTYQTGADPWQLFAIWAVLGLPLACAVRHDALWAAWVIVAVAALSLWVHAQTGRVWQVRLQDSGVHLTAWALSMLMLAGLSAPARQWSGAGVWAWRLGITLVTLGLVTSTALAGLFDSQVSPMFWAGLLLLVAGLWGLSQARAFDLYGVSVLALALNTLLVCGLARLLFEGTRGNETFLWLLLGLLAASLLAFTVKQVMAQAQHHAGVPTAPGGQA